MKTALIIGGGFAGCAMAHQFQLAGGWDVTLIEAGSQLGAGVRTQWLGGHPYTFGPRHFLTQNEKVWQFIDKYVPLRRCNEHEFLTYVEQDAAFYTYPIHEDDIPRMPNKDEINRDLLELGEYNLPPATDFEEYWCQKIGKTLYDKFINQYSKKMWMLDSNTALDTFKWSPKGTTLKSGPRAGWDTALSGYPQARNGYDDYFKIASEGAEVKFNTIANHYRIDRKRVYVNGVGAGYDVIVNTISPDIIFTYEFGHLPFIGRDLTTLILPVEFALPKDVYFCYYAGREPFTRVTEYKKFTQHHDPSSTLITLEYPSKNGRLYPLPIKSEQARAKKYFDLMPDGVFSIGRAGSYDYAIDIDDCIAQAMDVMEKLR